MRSGPNEISNLNLDDDHDENFNYWKQQVILSCKKIFALAQQCVSNNPSLKKVVIVKRPPRFDSEVAAHLSNYGNNMLDEIWMRSGRPENIEIVTQEIECQGEDLIQSYGNPNDKQFDGIHLRGPQAIPYMTRSFIKMVVKSFPDLKSSHPKNL